jgi:hypothetical protein
MKTDALPYLVESLKVVAQSPLSFVGLIAFVIAIGLFIVFRPGQKYGSMTILGAFAMFIGSIVALSLSVTKGFSEPHRMYYVSADVPAPNSEDAVVHMGVFRKSSGNAWEEVALKPGESYYYTFKYDGQADGRFYLIDDSRQGRVEVNIEERKIYWQPLGKPERHQIYSIVAAL